jgi:hypothetical protein
LLDFFSLRTDSLPAWGFAMVHVYTAAVAGVPGMRLATIRTYIHPRNIGVQVD